MFIEFEGNSFLRGSDGRKSSCEIFVTSHSARPNRAETITDSDYKHATPGGVGVAKNSWPGPSVKRPQ
jgi:hypothetical protein